MSSNNTRSSIAKRIKALRKERKYSQVYVAQDLSITQAAYSRIENSMNGILAEHVIKLSDIFEVTTDFILKGNSKLTEVSYETGFVPLITAKAHAGFVENFKKRINFDDRDWFKIPGFNPTQDYRLFEVEGESMVPTILPGDILICQVLQDLNRALNGTLLLLITKDAVLAKRLEKIDHDKIVVLNDNANFPEQKVDIKISDIQEVLVIRGKISSSLVPGHQLLSFGKFEEMEESLEMLKKEMFSLRKQVLNKK
ncbi:XRE family transcriptional regulator [Salinimicrobium sp. WS361]|uniref:XRE family transcriptional regulator n=1 Tax=Salinimicrobium sp. WS361 TaxID=3425123 RepID=UPI003D6E5653